MNSETPETIALIQQQNKMLQQTISLLSNQLNLFVEYIKNK